MTQSAQVAGGGRKAGSRTREDVVRALRRYAELYGPAFTSAAFNPATARWRSRPELIDRYYAGDPATGEPWPSLNAIKALCGGSFNAARELAGLEPNRAGPAPGARSRPAGLFGPIRDGHPHGVMVAPKVAERQLEKARARARAAEEQTERLRAKLTVVREEARDEVARAEAALANARAEAAVSAAAPPAEPNVDEGLPERLASAERRAARLAEELSEVREIAGRVRAAEARADAAEARAAEAERKMIEQGTAVTGEIRPLTADEIRALRSEGPAGPAVLAAALKKLGSARASGGVEPLSAALVEVARAAINWRNRLRV